MTGPDNRANLRAFHVMATTLPLEGQDNLYTFMVRTLSERVPEEVWAEALAESLRLIRRHNPDVAVMSASEVAG